MALLLETQTFVLSTATVSLESLWNLFASVMKK